jgi:hypothetical protein
MSSKLNGQVLLCVRGWHGKAHPSYANCFQKEVSWTFWRQPSHADKNKNHSLCKRLGFTVRAKSCKVTTIHNSLHSQGKPLSVGITQELQLRDAMGSTPCLSLWLCLEVIFLILLHPCSMEQLLGKAFRLTLAVCTRALAEGQLFGTGVRLEHLRNNFNCPTLKLDLLPHPLRVQDESQRRCRWAHST